MTEARITPYVVNYVFDMDEYVAYFDDLDEMLCWCSKRYAFSDCEDGMLQILAIAAEGEKLRYVGWQPGMVYEYVNGAGEMVWSNAFPGWDH